MKVKNMVKELIAGEERAFDSGHASTLVQAADGTVIAAWFGGSWEKKGFKFEETGTFTSTTFRSLFSRFKPTKK